LIAVKPVPVPVGANTSVPIARPKFVRAAEADVAFVPPLAITKVPVVIDAALTPVAGSLATSKVPVVIEDALTPDEGSWAAGRVPVVIDAALTPVVGNLATSKVPEVIVAALPVNAVP
jgi:hypothetical protein